MIDFEDSVGQHVPIHTRESLERYFLYGLPPGGFLTHVLTNNLYGAYASADYQNKEKMQPIVEWLTTRAPGGSYGSHEAMNQWLRDEDGCRARYREQVEKEYTWRSLKGTAK
jgi:hypothetical protein